MSLVDAISDITARLRQGRFSNEQAISQGIVLRILQELGWDTWDTTVVWPEYQTGEGRADFALCHPSSKPCICIEVKQPGKAEDAVRQALEYAFHTGVPFIILTDGKSWGFYLPAEQGSYDERRVYKLDLFERQPSESARILESYLARSRVESGEALELARQEYRNRNRRSLARAAIPEAWKELVEKGDEYLFELLAGAVETKAGVRPQDDDVTEFLAQLGNTVVRQPAVATSQTPPSSYATRIPMQPPKHFDPPDSSRRGTLVLRGKHYAYNNAKDAMIILLRELANTDSTFLARCAQHPDAQGRIRKYIARTKEELYPDRPDLQDLKEPLPGGWFVATNLNNVLKKSIIRLATEVAGLQFGEDVVVEF